MYEQPDLNAESDYPVGEVLAFAGNWRVIREADTKTEWTQVFVDGKWLFPDCGWKCKHCKSCLGCLRKTAVTWIKNEIPVLDVGDIICQQSPSGLHEPTEDWEDTGVAEEAVDAVTTEGDKE